METEPQKYNHKRQIMIKLRHHIGKAGIIGVALSHLCCLGLGAHLALIAPAFSYFLMSNAFMIALISISLFASLLGIFISYLKHRYVLPLIISAISSTIIIISSFIVHETPLFFIGMLGLISASIYNALYERSSCAKRCAVKKS